MIIRISRDGVIDQAERGIPRENTGDAVLSHQNCRMCIEHQVTSDRRPALDVEGVRGREPY
jgi:hypothetical protein